jgi:hypothetical protein
METEQQRILKLLEAKKITADEAARLLDALGGPGNGSKAKMLKVRVYDRETGKNKVNVTVPISLVRWGMQFVPESAQMKLNEHHVSFDQIADALETGYQGKLVEVDDEDDTEKVEIYLE